ncbi:MAG: response regulator [Cyclobacteriaceae bacterium]|nr:response regulator [Cyclobacteriaceae bacterium]
MKTNSQQPFLHQTKGKVVAAFILVLFAIGGALSITYFGFGELLEKIDTITTPNENIQVLNNFYRQVTQLEQEHRALALRSPRQASQKILQESQLLLRSLDTLRTLLWNEHQNVRLQEIETILQKRNKLFLRYLHERSAQLKNNQYSIQLDSLSRFLLHYQPDRDSSVVTTEKKITTTSYQTPERDNEKKERSFIGRIFSSKKTTPEDAGQIEIREEINIITDTIAISRQDSALAQIALIMKGIEQAQRTTDELLAKRELELVTVSAALLHQLMDVLHEIEQDEIAQLQANHLQSGELFNRSITRMIILLLVFLLGIGMLVFFILSDISKSQYYRIQLENAKQQADQLREVKERFLANMSHEIRTPLQSILGFAEQLEDKPEQESVHAIRQSSEHLLHIVNEVLDYSRIESNKFELLREPFNLKNVLAEIEAAYRLPIEKKGLAFMVKSSGLKDIKVLGDAFRLRQILHNLLSNAIKFTNKGYVSMETNVVDTGYRMECTFTINDTGIGIHKEDLDRIFEQFEQANASIVTQFGGTGLGLSIVRALVNAQYGVLDVKSEPGAGTTFTIKLGFDKAPFSTKDVVVEKTSPDTTIGPAKVLIVDDDLLILKLCSIILNKHHIHHVTENEPQKLLAGELPDGITHVLMDIRMPHISGITLREELHKRFSSSTKFIALTAHALADEQKKIMESGFAAILLKPFREKELLQALENKVEWLPMDTIHEELDFSALQKLTMNDQSLLKSVILQFIEDSKKDIQELSALLEDGQYGLVREYVHRLSGRVGQIGALNLSTSLRQTETALHENTSVTELLNHLWNQIKAIEKLINTLEDKVTTLN